MKKVRSVDDGGLRSATLPAMGATSNNLAASTPPPGVRGCHTGSLRLSDVRAGLYGGGGGSSSSSHRGTHQIGRTMVSSSSLMSPQLGAASGSSNGRFQVEFSSEVGRGTFV
jgi:hypothetical protein